MFGFDIPGWVLAAAALAALALLVFALLNWLYAKAQAAVSGSGSTPPAPAPSPSPAETVKKVQELIDKLRAEQRPPTEDECRQLRDALAQVRTEGAPDSLVEPIKKAIDKLCD